MGKTFGGDSKPAGDIPSKFAEDRNETADRHTKKTLSSARRDLVKLALRNTMSKYGLPSEWMDCRTLSVAAAGKQPGMHVLLTVRQADQQILKYVHAFQDNFRREIEGIDPQAHQWLFSVSWEFYGKAGKAERATHREPEDDIASDLHALHAVMSQPAELENRSGGSCAKQPS